MRSKEILGMFKRHQKAIVGLIIVCTVSVALGCAFAAYPLLYAGRIYPSISVHSVELSGLTREAATALLTSSLSTSQADPLYLRGDERTWTLDREDAGRRYDWAGTAEAAYQVGRHGTWYERALSAWRTRLQGRSLEPHLQPADPGRVRVLLDAMAPEVRVAPADAELHIDANGVSCVPGRAGRALDIKATTERVIAALAEDEAEVEIATTILPPDLRQPEPGCAEARQLLSRPFTLVVDDPLTNYSADFEAAPSRVATWLRAVALRDQIVLELEQGRVENWLVEIAPHLEPERILDIDESRQRVLRALEDRGHQARSVIRHPETTYVVQPGDVLFDIAYSHGFPQWRLEEANPDVEPDELLIGMELTIPSIDVLFPEPLHPHKRIEINLPEQRLRAYEDDELVYDFTCSSGMTSTPTIAGQFQVLFKEPDAYAQRWDLEMPHFMAIYYEGPDFANGIHELPTRADGERLWASVLGWPASYGCIILDVGDAEELYDWAPVGTLVRIEGVAPGTPTREEQREQAAQ
jgi:hypothetical protein